MRSLGLLIRAYIFSSPADTYHNVVVVVVWNGDNIAADRIVSCSLVDGTSLVVRNDPEGDRAEFERNRR